MTIYALGAALALTALSTVDGFLAPIVRSVERSTDRAFSSSQTGRKRTREIVSSSWRHVSTCRAAASTSAAADADTQQVCDVLVLGSGPAARAVSSLLAATGDLKVVMADQNMDREWPPNYGVWKDEWQAVLDRYSAAGVTLTGGKVGNAIDREWDVTDCYFGGSFDIPVEDRMRLDRPYLRVDKNALRDSLTASDGGGSYSTLYANHFSRAVSVNVYEPADSLVHDGQGTTIQLKTAKDEIVTVRSKLVVDCTGHETDLVLRETRDPFRPPGFQIAYGFLVDVDESGQTDPCQIGPYDKEAMTLFDYRTDHFDDQDENSQQKVESAPTFMYAMPLQGNQIFFEETSLVARPAVSFQECKDRCFRRLEYHGIKVVAVKEEEFCYIPMGGALPAKDQRIAALGGAAAQVHPSTGYHLCRCMMGAADVAAAIQKELLSNSQNPNLDRAAAAAYHALWPPSNIRQRNFAVFGGEFLMKQNVVGLRGFFDGFFVLPVELWGGFLAGWPGLPNNEKHETWLARLWFGISFVLRLPLPVALDMLASIAAYTVSEGVPLPQSVTPLLGEPESYEYRRNNDNVGDVAAKQEARKMIEESKVTEDLPVAFGEADGSSTKAATSKPISAAATSPEVSSGREQGEGGAKEEIRSVFQ